jgi:hypothetical protein
MKTQKIVAGMVCFQYKRGDENQRAYPPILN